MSKKKLCQIEFEPIFLLTEENKIVRSLFGKNYENKNNKGKKKR